LSLLADLNKVQTFFTPGQFNRDVTMYPVGLSPNVGCFQSRSMPTFYFHSTQNISNQIQKDNIDAEGPLVTFSSFQGYSNLKQQIRPSKSAFGLSESAYTGAYAVLPALVVGNRELNPVFTKCQEAVNRHQPFEAISRGITVTKTNGFKFRFETAISLDWSQLSPENQTLEYFISELVFPTLHIWNVDGIAMSKAILVAFPLQVALPFPPNLGAPRFPNTLLSVFIC
jgi:hypothetical protein